MLWNQFSKLLFSISVLFLFACNGRQDQNELAQTDTVFIKNSDSQNADDERIQEEKLKSLGGVTLANIEKEVKCNLTKVRYILNEVVADSNDLALVVEHLGKQTFKSALSEKDMNCPYPVMCVVYLYMNEEDLINQDNVASFSVTPATGVDIYVSSRKLSEYK